MTNEQKQAWEETKRYRAELDKQEMEQDEDIRDAAQRELDEMDAAVEARDKRRQEYLDAHGPIWKPIINQHFMDPDNYTMDFGPEFHPAYPITPTDAMKELSTQLRESACRGRTDELRQLAKQGADINKGDPAGEYAAAHWAALMGKTEALDALIELGANLSAITMYHRTPLHYAAHEGNDECVRSLLRAGASTEVKDRDEATPAMLAKMAGKDSTFKLLCQGVSAE
eukprot:CAMPEP_0202821766 /NCGR_PEP_ID=MMETSP1389-20130828/10596_1 /ASSEMBLY_ACC=CAM_ASM_000865 /TAXON_ID=302021 /ORGANISM="Rhodomonas sp., Strain CCMP768" /LENGTH=226 /DNA_ID=CAMNT_0049494587 /DNA_START=2 /DNA_END=682 /DNA_ORIENTATION=-